MFVNSHILCNPLQTPGSLDNHPSLGSPRPRKNATREDAPTIVEGRDAGSVHLTPLSPWRADSLARASRRASTGVCADDFENGKHCVLADASAAAISEAVYRI